MVNRIKEKYNLNDYNFCFSPTINKKSEKIALDLISKSPESNVFSNLYDLGKKRSLRLAVMRNYYMDQYNHNPVINSNLSVNTTFEERQKVFIKRVEEKRTK